MPQRSHQDSSRRSIEVTVANIRANLVAAREALDALLKNEAVLLAIEKASQRLIQTLAAKGTIFACGNGGSMCDAMHFAEELTGRYQKNRPGMSAVAISDPGHISCVANDFGYEHVFSRYIESHARKGDSLLAISTSGQSPSILNAAKAARSLDIKVVGLTGRTNSELEPLADICICCPAGQFADRIQELHIKVIHNLIELIERHFYPENYDKDP
jgi:D-sedoheptulose 7-phosphate isomerase